MTNRPRTLLEEFEILKQAEANRRPIPIPKTIPNGDVSPAYRAIMERKLSDPDWQARVAAASARERARRRGSILRKRTRLITRDGSHCYLCNAELDDTMHIEHVAPRSRGGTDDLWNLALACGQCNYRKADQIVAFTVFDRTPVFVRVG